MSWREQRPSTKGWLLFDIADKPVNPAEFERALLNLDGLEFEEVLAMTSIAAMMNLDTSPWVVMHECDDSQSSNYTIEVIVPPEERELMAVYDRYN